VVTGRIDRGEIKVGDPWRSGSARKDDVECGDAVEMFHKTWLRDGRRQCRAAAARVERTDVERGQVVAKPGSITPHTKFNAEVVV